MTTRMKTTTTTMMMMMTHDDEDDNNDEDNDDNDDWIKNPQKNTVLSFVNYTMFLSFITIFYTYL